MSHFLRLLASENKEQSLKDMCNLYRNGFNDRGHFEVSLDSFKVIPGQPFAYWVSEAVRAIFAAGSAKQYEYKQGIATADDFRFLRSWWEASYKVDGYLPISKGGPYSPWYQDLDLVVQWHNDGEQIRAFPKSRPQNIGHFGRIGITWPFRTQKGLNTRAFPAGSAFTIQGMAAFHETNDVDDVLVLLALTNSTAFKQLLLLVVGFFAFQTGPMSSIPIPKMEEPTRNALIRIAKSAWFHKLSLDSVCETSHAFLLPAKLRARLGNFEIDSFETELCNLQVEIDELAFDLYGFSDADRVAALGSSDGADEDASDEAESDHDSEDDDGAEAIDQTDGLLSWAAGVAFGRFDWSLATGEREAPPEPEPFDPLPSKSPGMLPDGADPFHAHSGILVDDQGHPTDLARLIEEVLARVEAPVPADVRRWLQRDFFPLHLKQYSKSRRKAPIYWPISTSSGSYTLWLYYPSLTDQTLFTAVNDFIEPKLKQVGQDVAALRTKGSARTRDDEKNFEALQALELELVELRDTLLAIAQTYHPNHDDGVQITAAPLWQLFRHKPWQKILKDTWAKLEKGDYDWAHLAMAYWPDRVREKCMTDKSLAIAHDLEHLYVEPDPKSTKARGRKKNG